MADIGRMIAGARGYGRRGYDDTRSRNIGMTLRALGGIGQIGAQVTQGIQSFQRDAQIAAEREKTENRLRAADIMAKHLGSLGKENIDSDPFAIVAGAFGDNPGAMNQHGIVAESIQTTRQWQKLKKDNIRFEQDQDLFELNKLKIEIANESNQLALTRTQKRFDIQEALSDLHAGKTTEERDEALKTAAADLKSKHGDEFEAYGSIIDEEVRAKIEGRSESKLRTAQTIESQRNAMQAPTIDSVKTRRSEAAALPLGDPNKKPKGDLADEQGLIVYNEQALLTQKALAAIDDTAQYAAAYRDQVLEPLSPAQRHVKYNHSILEVMKAGIITQDIGEWTGDDIRQLMQSNPVKYGGLVELLNAKGEFDANLLSAAMRERTVWDAGTAAIAWMRANGYDENQATEQIKKNLAPFMKLEGDGKFKGSDRDPTVGIDITKKVRQEAALSRMLAAGSKIRGMTALSEILKTTLKGNIQLRDQKSQNISLGTQPPVGMRTQPDRLVARPDSDQFRRAYHPDDAAVARQYSLNSRGQDISRELTEFFLALDKAKTKKEEEALKKQLDASLRERQKSLDAGLVR